MRIDLSLLNEEVQIGTDLAENVLTDNKKLSAAIIDSGVHGSQFGAILNELKNWYYGAYLYNHIKPSQVEIENKVEELMR